MSKLKELYYSAKQKWRQNQDKIMPWYNFGRDVITSATVIPEEPRIVDYIEFGFQVKDSYQDIFGGSKINGLKTKNGEKVMLNDQMAQIVRDLVFQYHDKGVTLIGEEEKVLVYVVKLNNAKLIWSEEDAKCSHVFVHPDEFEAAYVGIENLFKKKFPDGKVIISGANSNKSSFLEEDKTQNTFIPFKRCMEFSQYINKYFAKNINRSILFYGPPGSGKTNLIKGIVWEMQARTLKFVDMHKLDITVVLDIIKCYNPDCIIFEDIDHLENNEIHFLLERIEHLNNNVKLILASANEVSSLDNALLRPGRFDEAVEIKTLEKEVLMKLIGSGDDKADEELFNIVKDFPVAYIKEILKRIEALGREEALANIEDVKVRVKNLKVSNYDLNKIDSELEKMLKTADRFDDEEEYIDMEEEEDSCTSNE